MRWKGATRRRAGWTLPPNILPPVRRAGLEPAGDDGYFQTTNWLVAERNLDDLELKIQDGKETIKVGKQRASAYRPIARLRCRTPEIIKVDFKDATAIAALTPEQTAGKVVMADIPDLRREDRSGRCRCAQNEFMSKDEALKVALVLSANRSNRKGATRGRGD